jgi:phospholipid/cholesterol/gamma-HCH transport system substrate-binding protein
MSRAFRLGVFIVTTLGILGAGVFLIGSRQFLFSSTYVLKSNFKNVAGLGNGAEVRVGGINKGTVKQIALPNQPGGEMTVVMGMESSTRKVVRKDSIASIKTEGLLGNKYVEVTFGSDNAPSVEDGNTINSAPPLELSDLMNKTNDILDTTKQTMLNVQESSGQFKDISSKINRGEGTVGALVNNKQFYEQLNQATAQAKQGAAAFQENMEALKHNFFLRGFYNRRGYEDSGRLTENEIKELPKGPVLKKFSYDPKKVFDKADTAKLKNEKMLGDAGQFLEANPFGAAVVVVSGGTKGDADEVRELTQARAMVIRDYLVNNFRMDDSRIKTMGLGKSQEPSGDTGVVEITIFPPETTQRVPSKAEKGTMPPGVRSKPR